MSSLRQIAANRRNARKSTGPITSEGKERSRGNAIRHGLTAETVITAFEDEEDYQAFEAAVTADYDAETAVERELVLRLASVLWRIRRATGIETALFERLAEPRLKQNRPVLVTLDEEHNRPSLRAVPQLDTFEARDSDSGKQADVAECFLSLMEQPSFALDRLNRYEYVLWRQARQLVFTLEMLRSRQRPLAPSRFPFSFRRRRSDPFGEEGG